MPWWVSLVIQIVQLAIEQLNHDHASGKIDKAAVLADPNHPYTAELAQSVAARIAAAPAPDAAATQG
jgi:hypothetical protein